MPAIITTERPDAADARALIAELEAQLAPLYPRESRHGYNVDNWKPAFISTRPSDYMSAQAFREFRLLESTRTTRSAGFIRSVSCEGDCEAASLVKTSVLPVSWAFIIRALLTLIPGTDFRRKF